MNNEPVGVVCEFEGTLVGTLFEQLPDGTKLYTHPVNPYQSITNTKIEPTVVSYTNPVKELTDEEIDMLVHEYNCIDDYPHEFVRACIRKAQEK